MAGYTEEWLTEFTSQLVEQTRDQITRASAKDVVAISGMVTLIGVSSVSKMVEQAAPAIKGRLVVFFPGDVETNNYRLLDACDGWN